MQRQLEKMTDLVRLIVQKMEINTEIVIDDRSKCDKNKNNMEISKLRQTFNIARHVSRFHASTTNNVSHTVEPNEKI
jgi:hypothetical protein